MELQQFGSMLGREAFEQAALRGGQVFSVAKRHVGNPASMIPMPPVMDTFHFSNQSSANTTPANTGEP